MISTVRILTDHIVNPDTDTLEIIARDAPDPASHRYEITGMDYAKNPQYDTGSLLARTSTVLMFQNGPIPQVGVNGITHEVLLAIVIDRLRGFQHGPFACAENAQALEHIEEALCHLKTRTHNRIKRGVEGTYNA